MRYAKGKERQRFPKNGFAPSCRLDSVGCGRVTRLLVGEINSLWALLCTSLCTCLVRSREVAIREVIENRSGDEEPSFWTPKKMKEEFVRAQVKEQLAVPVFSQSQQVS